jgi:FixJ family two-component response regulator
MEKTVHIVDDDLSFRTALTRVLEKSGYRVIAYRSADEILARLPAQDSLNCILLDVKIPGLSGPELQQRLSELGATVPIIFLSGYNDLPVAVRTIKAGADDFLSKPVSRETLVASIERALGRHGLQLQRLRELDEQRQLFSSLTRRQKEVFARVVQGKLNKEIAFELGTTERTVKAHRHKVMEKMRARSLAGLVSLAERLGLMSKPE